MNGIWDNPVARQALRQGQRRWPLAAVLLLAGAGGLGLLLQKYWMELELYSFLQPSGLSRWLGLCLLAQTGVALPWAAVRGTMLWRRLRLDGQLDEYRRSRMPARQIVLGALLGAVSPVLLLLGLSLLVSLGAALVTHQVDAGSVLIVHLLLGTQSLALASAGLWLAGRTRYPGLAIPLALTLLAAVVCGVWALNPFYGSLRQPEAWIYLTLIPNPVTAVGNALGTDVLRFSWVYEHVGAHDYFYVYPPAWQTLAFYGTLGGGLLALSGRRLAALE